MVKIWDGLYSARVYTYFWQRNAYIVPLKYLNKHFCSKSLCYFSYLMRHEEVDCRINSTFCAVQINLNKFGDLALRLEIVSSFQFYFAFLCLDSGWAYTHFSILIPLSNNHYILFLCINHHIKTLLIESSSTLAVSVTYM